MAESMLQGHTEWLRKAEAKVVCLSSGSALTHNGVVYTATAGRA